MVKVPGKEGYLDVVQEDLEEEGHLGYNLSHSKVRAQLRDSGDGVRGQGWQGRLVMWSHQRVKWVMWVDVFYLSIYLFILNTLSCPGVCNGNFDKVHHMPLKF